MTLTFKKGRHSLALLMAMLFLGFTHNIQAQTPKFKVIAFYNASFDIAHISFANEANVWFAQQATKYGFQYESTKNWNNLNPTFLANYQVVMFLDDRPTGASQKAAFQQYMQNGGGFIGFHVCAFNTNPGEWDWYHNQFLATGAFRTNTWGPTTAVFKVEDKTHYATVGLPDKFTSAVSEWYGWTKDLRTNPDIRILCSIDPSSFPLGTDPNQSWYNGYYPIVWANKNYKMLYANFGHNDIDYAHGNATKSFTFSNPTQNKIIIQSLLHMGGVSVPEVEIPGTVQAEAYDDMAGIQVENTSDAGGGQNVGYIDAGDWLDYKVNVKTAGTYSIEYRVASTSATGTIQLKSGANTLSTVTVPNTTGWQNWQTVTTTATLSAGSQTLRIQAGTGGYNINWIKFSTGTPNIAPTVSLTAPLNNSTYNAPASVSIAANAADADGSVTKVEFFNGATKIGDDATSPYTFTWTNVAAGTYSITAKATDNVGVSTTSAAVSITVKPVVNITPTIVLTAPANNTTFTTPASVNIAADASDADGSIAKVEFFNGATKLGEDATTPYTFTWANVAAGAYTITARATDNLGGTATSQAASIVVAKPVYDIPGTVQAEAYESMSGIQLESTSDEGGGQNVGYIEPNDWMDYKVNIIAAGLYKIEYRVASINATGTIQLKSGANTLTTVTVPNTGAWQNWQTISTTTTLAAGQQILRLQAGVGGYNINWIRFSNDFTPNNAPTVSLTAPANNSTYNAPASVSMAATAADADGSVSKVEFYNGATKVGEDATSPYSFNWTNVAAGSYTITAKAIDNLGASTTSSAATIVVNASVNVAPTVSLTAPANNASFNAPASVSITATAADADGSVSKVEFFSGSTKLGEDLTSPYAFTWTNVAVGTYIIMAKATDNLGASASSAAVSITVKTSTNPCSGIPTYVENNGYVAGSRVQNASGLYQCKPYPYSGWCNGAAWAYAPGTGAYWADAWDKTGNCTAKTGAADDVISVTEINGANAISILPNPTTQSVLVKLNVSNTTSPEYTLINPLGVEVSKGTLNGNQEAVVDLTGMQNGIYTIRIISEGNAWTNKIIKQ